MFQLLVVFGILTASLMGLGLTVPGSGFTWRWFSVVCIAGPVVFIAAVIFVPETPFYLVKYGRRSEAKASLRWLRGSRYNVEPELKRLERSALERAAEESHFFEVFHWWAAKPLLVAVGLMFFQQMAGINAAIFFTTDIFSAAGSDVDPSISTVIVNCVNLAMTLVSLILVDILGRKVLMLVSEVFMALSMAALGTYFYLKEQDDPNVSSLGWLPLVSLIVFIAAFAIGLGPIPWIMTIEIVPQKVKGPATSIANFVNWLAAFVVTKTFVDLKEGLTDAGAFWFFGAVSVVGVVFCALAVPETSAKTPDQIQAFFGNGPLAAKGSRAPHR